MCEEHLVLADRLHTLEERFTALEAEKTALEADRDRFHNLYELVTIELARTRRHLFGRKAEVVDSNQAQFAFEGAWPEAVILPSRGSEGSGAGDRRKRKAQPHGRKVVPEHLPLERIELDPPDLEDGMVCIGEEVSEKLDYRAGSYVRVQVVRKKYAWPHEEERGVKIAEVPEQPIPRCKASVGLLAQVIVSKYADHIPLNRQTKMAKREGVDLPRSSLGGWLDPCAALLRRITDAMHTDALTHPWIGVDATGVLIQQPEQCHRGHFWVMVAGGDHVLFRYSRRHTSEAAHDLFKGYKGYVHADASSVYHQLYQHEDVIEVGCWAHTRRYFFESLTTDEDRALAAIGFIGRLYTINRELADLAVEKKTTTRRSRAGPVVDAFYDWIEDERAKVLPKSPIGKAMQYALNHREALSRFLDDGRLRLDNNLSELQLRREVVGRKNWLFCGSDGGAKWNTVFVSLIASCELHGIEPRAYLRDTLSLLPRWKANNVLALAPKFWNQTLEQEETQQLLAADVLRAVSVR